MRDRIPAGRVAERGFAVLVVLALLALILLLVAANTHTTDWLRREVKLVEKKQGERLAVVTANQPPAGVKTPQTLPAP